MKKKKTQTLTIYLYVLIHIYIQEKMWIFQNLLQPRLHIDSTTQRSERSLLYRRGPFSERLIAALTWGGRGKILEILVQCIFFLNLTIRELLYEPSCASVGSLVRYFINLSFPYKAWSYTSKALIVAFYNLPFIFISKYDSIHKESISITILFPHPFHVIITPFLVCRFLSIVASF